LFRNYSRRQGPHTYFRLLAGKGLEGFQIPFQDSDSERGKGKRQFQYKTSVLLPNDLATAEAVAAWIAASRLCLEMADNFQKEDEHGEAFDSCVADLLGEMEK